MKNRPKQKRRKCIDQHHQDRYAFHQHGYIFDYLQHVSNLPKEIRQKNSESKTFDSFLATEKFQKKYFEEDTSIQ